MKHPAAFLKICSLSAMLVFIQTTTVFSYRVLVNLNTYNWTERRPENAIENAIERLDELRCDGVWTLQHNNSFTDEEWKIVYDKLGPYIVTETQVSRSGLDHIAGLLGRLPNQQMSYIETIGRNKYRHTNVTLTPEEVDQVSAIRDNQKLLVNVRVYGSPTSANGKNVDALLANPKVAGISMEYVLAAIRDDLNGASRLVKAVEASGKKLFVLFNGTRTTEDRAKIIENLNTWGPDLMKSDRAYLVFLKYNGTENDWFGETESIKASIAYAVNHPNYTGRGMGPRDSSLLPPTIAPINNKQGEPNMSIHVPVSISHPQKEAAALTLYGLSSNPAVIPHENITFEGSGANRVAIITPAIDKMGAATITITVSDGDRTAKTSFDVSIPPMLGTIENQIINVNTITKPLAFTVGSNAVMSGISTDQAIVPNGAITFEGSGANRTVTVTPAQNKSGTVQITIRATLGSYTNNSSFWLTIIPDDVPDVLFADNFITANNLNPHAPNQVPQNLNKNLDTRQSGEAGTRTGYWEPPFIWSDPELGKSVAPNANVPSAIYTGSTDNTRIFNNTLQVGDGNEGVGMVLLEKDFSCWLSKPTGCSFELSFDLAMENIGTEWTSVFMTDSINRNRADSKLSFLMQGNGVVKINNSITVSTPEGFNPRAMNTFTFAITMTNETSGTLSLLINGVEAHSNVAFSFANPKQWQLGWIGWAGSQAHFDNLKIGGKPNPVNVMETPSGNLRTASNLYNLKVNHNSLVISGLSIPKSSSAELFVYNMKGRVVDRKPLDQLNTGDGLYSYSTAGFSNGIYYMIVKNLENMSIKRKFFVMR